MRYLHLEENDFIKFVDYIGSVSHSYRSGNRRSYISKIMLSYSCGKIELETAKKDLKYFRKLLSENDSNGNLEHLTEIVKILEKSIESSVH